MGEFVAARPCQIITVGRSFQFLGKAEDDGVARRLAESVVDFLKAVDIDADNRQRPAEGWAASSMHLSTILVVRHAVGQVGHRIVQSQIQDAGFAPLAFRNVLVRRDPAAILHGLVGYADGPTILQLG